MAQQKKKNKRKKRWGKKDALSVIADKDILFSKECFPVDSQL